MIFAKFLSKEVVGFFLMFSVFIVYEFIQFLITPTFSYNLNNSEKALTFFSIFFAVFIFLFFIFIIDLILEKFKISLFKKTITIFSALLISFIILITSETLIYAIFRIYISDTKGFFRFLYLVFFIAAFIYSHSFVKRNYSLIKNFKTKPFFSYIIIVFFILSCSIYLFRNVFKETPDLKNNLDVENFNPLNILIIAGDGIPAKYTSLYGYKRNTTPFLKKHPTLKKYKYAHHNSISTLSSVGSLLSGKNPLKTDLIYYPDVFLEDDSYKHLPGVLRSLGYKNALFGVRTQIDAFDIGFRNGFDISNGRKDSYFFIIDNLFSNTSDYLFLTAIFDKYIPRLMHILRLTDFRNYIREFGEGADFSTFDMEKEKKLTDFIVHTSKQNSPFFAYVHFMGTHGPLFFPNQKKYSKNKIQDIKFHQDFYDDAVIEFDRRIKRIFNYLEKENLLKSTLVIITSDHGKRHITSKIPLVIHDPRNKTKNYYKPVQLLDLAPTILQYIGIEPPDWMDGKSLTEEISFDRKIYFLSDIESYKFNPSKPAILGYGLIQCGTVFDYTVKNKKLDSYNLYEYDYCSNNSILNKTEAEKILKLKLDLS